MSRPPDAGASTPNPATARRDSEMTLHVALGIGAGIVAAMLFAVGGRSPLGVMLMYLAPLPILIVALGWHHLLGLLALSVGALTLTFLYQSKAGMAFAVGPGLSAWLPAYLALVERPVSAANDNRSPDAPWLSPGNMMFCLALIGAFSAFAALAAMSGTEIERYRTALEQAAGELLRGQAGRGAPPITPRQLADLMLAIAPPALGAGLTVMATANLWLGAKIVAASGRLRRPWPDVAMLRMPLAASLAFVAAALLMQSDGLLGFAAGALFGALLIGFFFQGLAVAHAVTRGVGARFAILAVLYFFLIVGSYFVLPLLALVGLVDSLFPLRRDGAAPPPRQNI